MKKLENKEMISNDTITIEETMENFIDEKYISFDKANRIRADKYVEKYYDEMKTHIEKYGYFVYDEFETIYVHTGRFIPNILNKKLELSGEDELAAVEEMIEGEGCFGMVLKRSMLNDRENIIHILKKSLKRYSNI